MSDLTEILKRQWEAYPNAQKTMNEGLASDIALANARRAQQERMDLKALFAQQAQPSYQQIGAIDPALAQEYLRNQFVMQKDQIEMANKQKQTEQIKFKMGKEQQDLMMKLAAATIDEYDRNIEAKMPQAQALDIYNRSSSRHLSENKQSGTIPPEYPSFDPESMNPEALRTVVKGQGFPTEKDIRRREYEKTATEQQANVDVGPVMTPEQFRGSNETDPLTGLTYQKPPLRRNQPTKLTGNEGAGFTSEQNAQFNVLQELLDANPNDEALRRSVIAKRQQIELQGGEQPQSEIVTPTQLQTKRVEQKTNEEREIKTAQIEATEKAADKKAIETYLRGPKPEAIRKLINESIEGDVQSGLARLGKFFGVAVPGGDALAALKVIQQQMARSLPYAPGSSSDKDVTNRLEMISNPATDEPIVNRLRALEEVIRDAEAYVVQKGDFLSDDQILDSIENGYLSEASALEMINNRMLNKGNPIYAPTQGNKTSTGVK